MPIVGCGFETSKQLSHIASASAVLERKEGTNERRNERRADALGKFYVQDVISCWKKNIYRWINNAFQHLVANTAKHRNTSQGTRRTNIITRNTIFAGSREARVKPPRLDLFRNTLVMGDMKLKGTAFWYRSESFSCNLTITIVGQCKVDQLLLSDYSKLTGHTRYEHERSSCLNSASRKKWWWSLDINSSLVWTF